MIRRTDEKLLVFVHEVTATLLDGKRHHTPGFGTFSTCARKATADRVACRTALFFTALLSVCSIASADSSDSPLVPQQEMTFAKAYLTKLREKDYEYVSSHVSPELRSEISHPKLDEIAKYFPSGALQSTELIGSQVNIAKEIWHGNFTFEYKFDNGWAVANVVLRRPADSVKPVVIGFHVNQFDASQKELNEFDLSGKSALHYSVLFSACAISIFILVTLIYCIRTPIANRKWLWILFVLGGIGSISINWTTGAYAFKILAYLIFGASATAASEHAPWVVSAAFPIGALTFWIRRQALLEATAASQSKDEDDRDSGASA